MDTSMSFALMPPSEQPSQGSARRYSAREWEEQKPTIHRLYTEEDRTLKDVIGILSNSGFIVSEKQVKDRLRKWNLNTKNEFENKDSAFRVNKQPVKEVNIDRFLKRKNISDSTLLSMASPINALSPAISVHTPHPSTPDREPASPHPAHSSAVVLAPSSPDNLKSDWSHLPQDLQFYLTYFKENVTYLHYSLIFDPEDCLRTHLLDAALRNDVLLYAVVGFSAYRRTLRNPEGKIQDFLQYYNKAVSLLLNSLARGEQHSIGTILAILQLATIEELLGDWINLLRHRKAAYDILTELYTPQTAMQNEMSRVVLGWYMRFEVFVSLTYGFGAILSREWFLYAQEFFQNQVGREPPNLNWKIESAIASSRLIAIDMASVFAMKESGEISHEQFLSENEVITRRIKEWMAKMDPALQDRRFLVTNFEGARPLEPDAFFDPYIPSTIYSGPLWVMNVVTMDWYTIDLTHKFETAMVLKTQTNMDCRALAFKICTLFEAVELWPGSPPGTILACQASLLSAFWFLPRDERYGMWARRKFAAIELNGYIYPYLFRTTMAAVFRDRSCMHWWLPNNERHPLIIRSIREFVEERKTLAKNAIEESSRDIKAIFARLRLDDRISIHSRVEQLSRRKTGQIPRTLEVLLSETQADVEILGEIIINIENQLHR